MVVKPLIQMSVQRHPYHLVTPSPWPLLGSGAALGLTAGGVLFMHGYTLGSTLLLGGFVTLLVTFYVWWRDVVREATYEGAHTAAVQSGLSLGMLLFIITEVMFFFSFFWAFLHASLAPAIQLGSVWPPTGVVTLDPTEVPLLNTAILLTSGATVTWAHHSIISGARSDALLSLGLTILLGAAFTALQAYEYIEAPFTISDSVYGATFFMATGFHGLHILIGTTFLIVCWFRLYNHHFTRLHHFGFTASAWYWHFVDVVWGFLYVLIYWWGS